jgi:phage terminase large subunit-like protein
MTYGQQLAARAEAKERLRARKTRIPLPWNKRGLSRLEKVIQFLEFLPITKGKLSGSKLRLLPSQRQFIEAIYNNNSLRLAVLSEPRGNGKTGLIAGLALCHLLGPEAEVRGECYSAGIDRDQAAMIFREMKAIIAQVPEFTARTNVRNNPKAIEVLEGPGVGSIYEPLSADARGAHGLAPSFWAYDELAQARERTLLDNLMTGMGKRARSLGVVISTQAESDDHPMSQLVDDGLSGIDPSIVVQLIAAPKEADVFNEEVIRACNPALGIFLDADVVFTEARQARRLPAQESHFRNLRCNQRIAATHDLLVTPTIWAQGDSPIAAEIFTDGRPIYGGLDLSGRLDLTALVLAAEDDDGCIHLLPTAWTPEKTIGARTVRDAAPYDAWHRNGQLHATPGLAVDYDFVLADIARIIEGMNLAQVNYDSWNINVLKQALGRIGMTLPLQSFVQGWKSFDPAIREFQVACTEDRVRHGGQPVLRWCIANTMIMRDPAGNQKPDKRRRYGRIDLAVAAIMAVGAMKASAVEPVDVATLVG